MLTVRKSNPGYVPPAGCSVDMTAWAKSLMLKLSVDRGQTPQKPRYA